MESKRLWKIHDDSTTGLMLTTEEFPWLIQITLAVVLFVLLGVWLVLYWILYLLLSWGRKR